jgi:hypothetical protein
MSIDNLSNTQTHMDREIHENIESFPVVEQEDSKNIVTSDDQPIHNRSEDEQVYIYD